MDEPLAYSVEEAACILGISRTKAYECVRTGQLRTIEVDRRLLVPAVAIDELLDNDQLRPRRRAVRRSVEEGMNRVEVVGRRSGSGGAGRVLTRSSMRRRRRARPPTQGYGPGRALLTQPFSKCRQKSFSGEFLRAPVTRRSLE